LPLRRKKGGHATKGSKLAQEMAKETRPLSSRTVLNPLPEEREKRNR